MLKRHSPQVRVPEVYGWCRDEEETFIYMEYLDGRTLQSCLDQLTDDELQDIAAQMASMLRGVRSLRQPPQDIFIGSPSRGSVQDQLWRHRGREPLGPLTTVQAFNEALHGLATELPQFPEHELYQTFRAAFSDTASIRFTHTDLHPLNIIISSSGCKVLGIIDWQESGWYPEYWEYVKTSFNFELSGTVV
ncbi:kinase-like domain-containing protein [Mycena metata]|uniref:Kinase-like domain-containing protein n=1 Tax=Mycena metata TaxID=1033252 RepID=A0AAD7JNA3_9AGAR|nr:kinase-like domain-containing protein [Mycena metata]